MVGGKAAQEAERIEQRRFSHARVGLGWQTAARKRLPLLFNGDTHQARASAAQNRVAMACRPLQAASAAQELPRGPR